jgi:hypothetical protein
MFRKVGLIICLVIAAILGYFGYRELSVDRTNLYKSIPALITNVSMTDKVTQSQSSVSNVTIVNRTTTYQLTANYSYTVNNKNYAGSYPLGQYSSYLMAQNEINNLMSNASRKNITVFYEIASPNRSVLNVAKNNSIGYFIGAVVFVIIGLIINFTTNVTFSLPYSNPYQQSNVVIYNNN